MSYELEDARPISAAQEDGFLICYNCKQKIHLSDRPTNKEGNIYSAAGRGEYLLSGLCEYCFDRIANLEDDK